MWTGLSSPNVLQNNSQACSDSSVSCEDGTDICFWKHRLPSVHKTFSTEGGKDWHYPPGRSLNCSVVQLKNPVHTEWTGAPSQEGPLQHLSLANPIIIIIIIFTSSPSLSAAAAAATYTKMRHICCLLEQIKAQTFRSKEESIVLRLLCLILFHQTPTERNQLQQSRKCLRKESRFKTFQVSAQTKNWWSVDGAHGKMLFNMSGGGYRGRRWSRFSWFTPDLGKLRPVGQI